MLKSVEPSEQFNEVLENHLEPSWAKLLRSATKVYLNNIVTRSLSYLMGWSGTEAMLLLCTSDGVLKVADTGTSFEHNECAAGTTDDDWSADIEPSNPVHKVELWVNDNPIYLRRSNDGVAWDDDILIPADSYYEYEAVTDKIGVKSANAGLPATYNIIMWR